MQKNMLHATFLVAITLYSSCLQCVEKLDIATILKDIEVIDPDLDTVDERYAYIVAQLRQNKMTVKDGITTIANSKKNEAIAQLKGQHMPDEIWDTLVMLIRKIQDAEVQYKATTSFDANFPSKLEQKVRMQLSKGTLPGKTHFIVTDMTEYDLSADLQPNNARIEYTSDYLVEKITVAEPVRSVSISSTMVTERSERKSDWLLRRFLLTMGSDSYFAYCCNTARTFVDNQSDFDNRYQKALLYWSYAMTYYADWSLVLAREWDSKEVVFWLQEELCKAQETASSAARHTADRIAWLKRIAGLQKAEEVSLQSDFTPDF